VNGAQPQGLACDPAVAWTGQPNRASNFCTSSHVGIAPPGGARLRVAIDPQPTYLFLWHGKQTTFRMALPTRSDLNEGCA